MHPDRVGPYLIDKKIGAGGMGTVYLARHAETGRVAALKVLPASLARESGFVARFTREVDAMKSLKNPAIVELYESGVDDETYYYSMEYVEGDTLTGLLRRVHRLDWQQVIEYSIQICSALKAAHDAGIIHRDLKPSNLLVTSDGKMKLTDFGVAQVFAAGKLTVTGGIVGTAEFMSPEQAQGQRATKKSDLYALGAVMYTMLTGRPPFTGKTTVEVIHKHRFGQFDRPRLVNPDIPFWLEEIVCQLLEKDPDKRFPDAYVLSRRLQEVLRKVQLSESKETAAAIPEVSDGTAPTVAAVTDAGPGAGTLMRDLVRAEIELSQKPHFIGKLFDNVWFLSAMLILTIAGGFWWFGTRELSPEQRFQQGVELAGHPEGADWLKARDEFFLPLLALDSEKWSAAVAPHLERIDAYELRSRLKVRPGLRNPAAPGFSTEAERFLKLAGSYRAAGDLAQAETTLTSLLALVGDDDNYRHVRQLAQEMLAEVEIEMGKGDERYVLLRESLTRADQLAADGNSLAARRLWESIIQLYGDDAGAQGEVARARARLMQETKTGT